MNSADELFVYGTLRPERAPAEIADVVKEMRLVGGGTVQGRLLELGGYPGLVGGEGRVSGSVFSLPQGKDILPELDAYEGFRVDQPLESLFVRERVTVQMDEGDRRECWVYRYNGQRRD